MMLRGPTRSKDGETRVPGSPTRAQSNAQKRNTLRRKLNTLTIGRGGFLTRRYAEVFPIDRRKKRSTGSDLLINLTTRSMAVRLYRESRWHGSLRPLATGEEMRIGDE
jgi:hypothetical protein